MEISALAIIADTVVESGINKTISKDLNVYD